MYGHSGDAVSQLRRTVAAGTVVLVVLSGCAGSRPIVIDPDRIPTEALLKRNASVKAVMLDGATRSGTFAGASDSLLLLESNRVAVAIPLDSVAYLNYDFALDNTTRQRHLGFLRGLGFGLTDAAILTLIYSSADNDVNKSTLFWITAITSAIPLTIYFTLESGHKGRELDEKAMTEFNAEVMKVPLRKRPGAIAKPMDRNPEPDRTKFPLLLNPAAADSLVLPPTMQPAPAGDTDTASSIEPAPPDTSGASVPPR